MVKLIKCDFLGYGCIEDEKCYITAGSFTESDSTEISNNFGLRFSIPILYFKEDDTMLITKREPGEGYFRWGTLFSNVDQELKGGVDGVILDEDTVDKIIDMWHHYDEYDAYRRDPEFILFKLEG